MNKFNYNEGYVPQLKDTSHTLPQPVSFEFGGELEDIKTCAVNAMRSMSAMCAAVYSACMQKLNGEADMFEEYNIDGE